jgi:hypothetical protein
VCPVSEEDTNALPVKDLGPAIAFYEAVLGERLGVRPYFGSASVSDRISVERLGVRPYFGGELLGISAYFGRDLPPA